MRVLHLKGLGCRSAVLLHTLLRSSPTCQQLLSSVLEPLDVRRLCAVAKQAGQVGTGEGRKGQVNILWVEDHVER